MRRTPALLLVPLLLLLPARAVAASDEPGVPDKAFQEAIDKAIDAGAAWLKGVQKSSGFVGGVVARGQTHYEIGTTALTGLAFLAAGMTPADRPVAAAMEWCRARDLARLGSRTTYDTGVLLMFAAEYWRERAKPARPGRGHGSSKGAEPGAPSPPPDARSWIRDMGTWLVSKQADRGGWSYPGTREDLSNTQYAVLGLRAARECGAPIPPGVFLRLIDRLLALQEPEGPKVMRAIPPARPGETTYLVDGGDRARGWSYLETPAQATGSMVTAAIAALAIGHDALTTPRRFEPYTPKYERDVGRAIQDGFAWLDHHFAVDRNPGRDAPAWHYYYLYGLERAAVLGGRDLIGKHDWYLAGARHLVGAQKGDGRWSTGALGGTDYDASDVVDTAWAVLFLARATRPGKPIPAPVVTPSGS